MPPKKQPQEPKMSWRAVQAISKRTKNGSFLSYSRIIERYVAMCELVLPEIPPADMDVIRMTLKDKLAIGLCRKSGYPDNKTKAITHTYKIPQESITRAVDRSYSGDTI